MEIEAPNGRWIEDVDELIAVLKEVRDEEGGDTPVRDEETGVHLHPYYVNGELHL